EWVGEGSEKGGAAAKGAASDMAGSLSKQRATSAGADAITGGGDLTADVKAGRRTLSSVPDDELPEALRKMSGAERQAHVDRQMKERAALSERMAELVRRRDAYVADQRQKAPVRGADSFDRAIENVFRAQIKGGEAPAAPRMRRARRASKSAQLRPAAAAPR